MLFIYNQLTDKEYCPTVAYYMIIICISPGYLSHLVQAEKKQEQNSLENNIVMNIRPYMALSTHNLKRTA